MIHYHGTPVSGPKEESHRFLAGRHALVSFAHPKNLPTVAETCQSFVLDNGAFTAWKAGRKLDFDGYCDWVSLWSRHPGFDWALVPDVIDGTTEENDRYISRWRERMHGDFALGVPVWHMHESLDRLTFLCRAYTRVALGSSGDYRHPGAKAWWERMREAMNATCDDQGRPRARLHGLRMMDPDIFSRLPLSSADSTNAAVNAGSLKRFGTYPAPSAAQRASVIADRIEATNSAPVWVDDTTRDDVVGIDIFPSWY